MARPEEFLGEVLGRPASERFDPADRDWICPFTERRCSKVPKKISSKKPVPMPVCSVIRNELLVCVCPNRLEEPDWASDIRGRLWDDVPDSEFLVAPEVKMEGFGNVDFVLVERSEEKIDRFLSVEAQAVDVTNSYRSAYEAWLENSDVEPPTFGLNADNVYKRYVTQLTRKGFLHHHWGTKIVSLIQDYMYEYIYKKYPFLTTDNLDDPAANVVFFVYGYEKPRSPSKLMLKQTVATSHANLSHASLYGEGPDKEKFETAVQRSLKRNRLI